MSDYEFKKPVLKLSAEEKKKLERKEYREALRANNICTRCGEENMSDKFFTCEVCRKKDIDEKEAKRELVEMDPSLRFCYECRKGKNRETDFTLSTAKKVFCDPCHEKKVKSNRSKTPTHEQKIQNAFDVFVKYKIPADVAVKELMPAAGKLHWLGADLDDYYKMAEKFERDEKLEADRQRRREAYKAGKIPDRFYSEFYS